MGETASYEVDDAKRRGYRFVRALPRAGGRRSPHGAGTISTLPPAASMA
jgi:hypothetical protein